MDPTKLAQGAQPDVLARYVAEIPVPQHHGHGGSIETIREATHAGRQIVIRTSYRIEVDGKPFEGDLILDNEGRLHCHSLPNYHFASAVEMVKRLIETYPDEFPRGEGSGGGHGGHEHGRDHDHGPRG